MQRFIDWFIGNLEENMYMEFIGVICLFVIPLAILFLGS